MVTSPQFTIDVYDKNDNLIGPGPLFNIISVTDETALDLTGRVTVQVPARDPRVT